jgi:hypothetical protein
LPELTSFDSSFEVSNKESKRRDIKRDPKLKEKEKLWDSILVEASSSSDEGYD